MTADSPRTGDRGPVGVILANTAVQVVGEVVSKAASLAFFAVMAREFGKEGFGEYTFALSLVVLFTVFAGFGTDTVLTRAVAQRREDLPPLFWGSIWLKLALGSLAVAGAVAVAVVGGYPPRVQVAIAVLGVASLADLVAKTLFATFLAYDDMRPVAKSVVLQRTLTAVVGVAAMVLGAGLVPVSFIYLLGSVAAVAYAGRELYRRDVRPRRSVSMTQARAILVTAVPLGISAIFTTVLFRIDAAMLSGFKDEAAVGLYGAAYRVLESTLFLTYAMTAAAVPTLSRLRRGTTPSVGSVFAFGLKVTTLSLMPIGAAFLLFPEPLLRLLFGGEYVEAASALRWLGGAAVFYGITYFAMNTVVAQGRQGVIPWVTGGLMLMNVLLNLVLIPRYSFDGAAAVTAATEVVGSAVMLFLALRLVGPVPVRRILSGPVAGVLAMAAVAALAGDGLIGLALAGVAYLVVTGATERAFFPEDFRRLSSRVAAQLGRAPRPA